MKSRESSNAAATPRYVKRALAGTLAKATAPVIVLQGAYGTGKTTLVKNEALFRDYHYVALADEEECARAQANPKQWAARLPHPVVIDDAHRVAGLLEAVHQALDEERAAASCEEEGHTGMPPSGDGRTKTPLVVLVASERLTADEALEAAIERFTLFPLTQAEIYGRAGCIVDDLFDGDVIQKFCSFHTRSDLRTMMRIGGFPTCVVQPVRSLCRRDDTDRSWHSFLRAPSSPSDPAENAIDQLIEKAILDKVLTTPGLSLGVDAVAQACSVDVATLTAYLEALQDRFIIHCLTMLGRKQPSLPTFTKTRIHSIDPRLVVEALQRAGHDIAVEPPVFAKVLRTFCIDQLIPAVQWASEPTECYHWKKFEHRVREVDLVLKRGNSLVGITMRNSMAARQDTIGALRLFAEEERFARGYIIYMGTSPRRLAENIWAIPISALWEEAAFMPGLSELVR